MLLVYYLLQKSNHTYHIDNLFKGTQYKDTIKMLLMREIHS
jgi:hypothetical protein